MSCCAPGAELAVLPSVRGSDEEVLIASHIVADGVRQTDLSVPGIHCGGCVRTIEKALDALAGVESARANLSTRRVTVRWQANGGPPPFVETLKRAGFEAHLFDVEAAESDGTQSELIRALAVAGFASSNIMLLSVSIWSGADADTRNLFHWLSLMIALPALAYSGRVFFRSAWRALAHGRTNMDVPISLGVLLAFGMSVYETVQHGSHAYFDAAISLLFFLLIGRTLDHMMRERARLAVRNLVRLAPRGAFVVQADGTQVYIPVEEIEPGMVVMLGAGERVPVDATVSRGDSELDVSLVSGESVPERATLGSTVRAGTLNLTGPLTLVATAKASNSFLAEMTGMMEAAEQGRSGYRRIADRAAALYAPVVHAAAFLTFIGWMAATGDLHNAITTAIAVLIITCPCALGLAVPIVQVIAAQKLFKNGIMVKDGSSFERLAEIDTVIFDKTGTLTSATPRLILAEHIDGESLSLAAALASHSRHPYSQAIVEAAAGLTPSSVLFDDINEQAGFGLQAKSGDTVYRLGRPSWALASPESLAETDSAILTRNGQRMSGFGFEDKLRADVAISLLKLKQDGLRVEVVSGDREEPVRLVAAALGVPYRFGVTPSEKVARIKALSAGGQRVLMVGDGLNDTPALGAAHASMAPASASDVGRCAADFVFLRQSLLAIPLAVAVAREARRLIRQNLAFAVAYNVVAVPIAVMGLVTPLIAAIAMSASSILVVANALRLKGGEGIVAEFPVAVSTAAILEAAE
jgi:Cu2+-exporting ATPase